MSDELGLLYEFPCSLVNTFSGHDVSTSVVKRLNYLWKTANELLRGSVSDSRTNMNGSNVVLCREMQRKFMFLAYEHSVDLPAYIKDKICTCCSIILIPSITCHVRIRKRTRHSGCNRKLRKCSTAALDTAVKYKMVKNDIVTTCLVCKSAAKRVPGAVRQKQSIASTVSSSSGPTFMNVSTNIEKSNTSIQGAFSVTSNSSSKVAVATALKHTSSGSFSFLKSTDTFVPLNSSTSSRIYSINSSNQASGGYVNLLQLEKNNKKLKKKAIVTTVSNTSTVTSISSAAVKPSLSSLQHLLKIRK